jgi:hypothetical protein
MIESYEQLRALIESARDDVEKAAGGNKTAGTRVRRLMQQIKNDAQALRLKVLETRESGE